MAKTDQRRIIFFFVLGYTCLLRRDSKQRTQRHKNIPLPFLDINFNLCCPKDRIALRSRDFIGTIGMKSVVRPLTMEDGERQRDTR